jgi:hypothetical protein
MLQATFTVSGAELTGELLEKIKNLFHGDSTNFEVTISVRPKEDPETARARIDRSIENIENQNNLVALSPEEYETVVKQLSRS